MRAAVVKEFGPIESHAVGDLPNPVAGPGQILVTVKAVAVNYVDSLVVTGKYQFLPERPFAPGKLPAGVVSALGPGVSGLKVGDRVLTLAEQGGYAEQVSVDARQCFKLPPSMSFIEAASMALVYDTSWFALRERARLKAGDSVLVLGSTGGVGLATVQLAKAMGARVLAGVSNAAKAPIALEAGADDIIDLSKDNLRDSLREQVYARNAGKGLDLGVDIVIDPVGGDAFDAALRALAWRGRLVVIGFASGRIPSVKANYLLVKNIEVSGLQVSDYRKRMPELMAQCMEEIFSLFEAGKLKPAATATYPLDFFGQALQDIVGRRVNGRIVLLPNS
ncbi:NADPH:quinone oxidoreductase family protein [Roseiarcaceae bacterium H3SJ34-1]|uniref:NADPH:quinone oxidoreductase family protein n=1 Tax=Terripilifer ovatus TaxID=3032367 RepID=UPI003AB93F2F|nr:NADPH:quinone oxidoreductase family protein [Roseiarcaceae bacterium H3SJ34-1]